MKTNLLIISLVLCALTQTNSLMAQSDNSIDVDGIIIHIPDLNNREDQEKLKMRAKQCVRTMNSYVTSMTKKAERDGRGEVHPTLQERRDFRAAALTCFINNGDSIIFDGVKTSPAMMEISTKRGSTITYNHRTVKQYFTNLINLIKNGRYTDLSITSSDIPQMKCTNIQRVGNKYQCIVCFTQKFVGRRGEITVTNDNDVKCTTVWFVTEPDTGEIEARLGDTKVTETDGQTRQ